ncbi:MAG TPA: wax ester/triacylglycerol synthase domain-containing protein, partial [Acidimicrobiales bacterium]|nr:wax ester/triacylglycerol synthase domain-containing protein [Acidimicrobiales bacterium]
RERFLDKIERGTRLIPRLRQKAVSAPFSVAPPAWVSDPHFDLSYHVRWVRAAGDGSLQSLLEMAEPIAMQGFDRARPLWEFTVVEGLADGRAALIQKVHHSVTDGVGGMKLAMMLLDLERDPARADEPMPDAPVALPVSRWGLLLDGIAHEQRRQAGIARRALAQVRSAAGRPVDVLREAVEGAASLARLLAPTFEPLSPIMRDRSLSVRFGTVAVSLTDMKTAARKAEGRLNDAFVAAAAGGLRRYHERHDAPVGSLRMSMPINIREGAGEALAGNQFVPARFEVPVSTVDPVARMRQLRTLIRSQRDEPALAATEAIAGVLNRLPTSVTTSLFGSMLKGIDFVTSNVPGAPIPVYLAGAKLEANFAFGPLAGAAANLTLLSYQDELHIGVNTDPAAIPDTDVFMAAMHEGFEEVGKA